MRSGHDLIQSEGIDVNSSTEFDSGGEISVCVVVCISVVISIRSFLAGDGSHGGGSLITFGDDGAHDIQCSLGRS